MDYDVLILGGGIIGCAVAYELSKYNINIALIERDMMLQTIFHLQIQLLFMMVQNQVVVKWLSWRREV